MGGALASKPLFSRVNGAGIYSVGCFLPRKPTPFDLQGKSLYSCEVRSCPKTDGLASDNSQKDSVETSCTVFTWVVEHPERKLEGPGRL